MVQESIFDVKVHLVYDMQEKATHLYLVMMVDGVPEFHFAGLLPLDIAFQVHLNCILFLFKLFLFIRFVD